MITIAEYAALSGHIYNTDCVRYGAINMMAYKTSENCLEGNYTGWARVEIDKHMLPSNHFYAQLYIKYNKGHATDAAIAYRGTLIRDWQNDLVDFASWWSDIVSHGQFDFYPQYLHPAILFFQKSREYVMQHYPHVNSVRVTGHSLGGAIAKLVNLTYYPSFAISFNAPGCGNMRGIQHEWAKNIFEINSQYGLINKIGKHLQPDSRLIVVNVPQHSQEAKEALDFYHQENAVADTLEKNVANTSWQFYGEKSIEYEVAQAIHSVSYIAPFGYVATQPEMRAEFISCNQQYAIQHWYQYYRILEQTGCQELHFFKDTWHIFYDQHSIDNMILALHQPENQQIAQIHI